MGEPILYGADTDGMLPVLLHPDEWLDGALVPSYHNSLGGAETYFYQNHPVIGELYRRHHAQELNFVGTVATIAAAIILTATAIADLLPISSGGR